MNHANAQGTKHGSLNMKSSIADKILAIMKLSLSDIVLDVGSGDGYYASRFSQQCGNVIAIDAYCEGLKSAFYSRANIVTVCSDACEWLHDAALEQITHVYFSNSFHDIACQKDFLSVLSRKLPHHAHLDMIEFYPDTPFGPPKSIRFSRESLKSLVESFGFRESAFADLQTHYFISFETIR